MRNTVIVLSLLAAAVVAWWFVSSRRPSGPAEGGGEVVVYVAHDKDYAVPLFQRFERETGIRVNARYDTEADKTIGHVQRLLAERDNPRCDLHWNNEPMHTIRLAREGIYAPYRSPLAGKIPPVFRDPNGLWTGFAARARVIVYHTATPGADRIRSLADFLKPEYKGKLCIARPRAGSTQTHMAVLYSLWGREKFLAWLRGLIANDVKFLESNSKVADSVANGVFMAGLTDTDDVISRKENRGLACDLIFPDADGMGTLVFPNTLAIVKGAPHPENAKKLYDWLLARELELCMSPSAQIPLSEDVSAPTGRFSISDIKHMQVDWAKVAAVRDECVKLLSEELSK